jgi:ribonuclease D
MSEPEVVCKNKRCREIVRELKKSDVISVDAEGVNLGKEGPLTLLQIGTIDGQVYLFDVHMNPDIFRRGKLIEILQSQERLKGCCTHVVTLLKVFDLERVALC